LIRTLSPTKFNLKRVRHDTPEGQETKANGAAEEEQRQVAPMSQKGPIQHSIISADATFTGDLISSGDVTFEGTVDGNIKCRCLTLSGQSTISGSVEAEAVHVFGTFNGEIHASKVVLSKTAKMLGDVFQETLEVHPGAWFDKTAKMLGDVFQETLEVHPGAWFEGKVNSLNAQRGHANGSGKATASKVSMTSPSTSTKAA
jgi:cytoskeletal protein CcmA (bactofilin family)